jgi:hypothetical protein
VSKSVQSAFQNHYKIQYNLLLSPGGSVVAQHTIRRVVAALLCRDAARLLKPRPALFNALQTYPWLHLLVVLCLHVLVLNVLPLALFSCVSFTLPDNARMARRTPRLMESQIAVEPTSKML